MGRQFPEKLESNQERQLREAWNTGLSAALDNDQITERDCPYTETALWLAWVGGMYKRKYRQLKEYYEQ